jgi:hypothetical protein
MPKGEEVPDGTEEEEVYILYFSEDFAFTIFSWSYVATYIRYILAFPEDLEESRF